MSALPLRIEDAQDAYKLHILEVNNTGNTLDVYGDRLSSQGFAVYCANNYDDGIKLARQYQPVLVVVYDDPSTNIDAIEWLKLQHTNSAWLAMTPLLILSDPVRLPLLKIEELPDRVVVLQRRADTLNQLTRTVHRILHTWGFE